MPLLMCDLDDTLVVRRPLFRAWAEDFLAEHALPTDRVDWMVRQDRGGTRPRDEMHAELAAIGYGRPFAEFTEREDAVADSYRLTGSTTEALARARAAGWRIAVVTNGTVRRQCIELRATGLESSVDAVCISEEIGVAKPDPRIFEVAAERAGTTLEGAWMIGDNLDADIAGARAVGVSSVWIDDPHTFLEFASGVEPDLVAQDLCDAVTQILRATA